MQCAPRGLHLLAPTPAVHPCALDGTPTSFTSTCWYVVECFQRDLLIMFVAMFRSASMSGDEYLELLVQAVSRTNLWLACMHVLTPRSTFETKYTDVCQRCHGLHNSKQTHTLWTDIHALLTCATIDVVQQSCNFDQVHEILCLINQVLYARLAGFFAAVPDWKRRWGCWHGRCCCAAFPLCWSRVTACPETSAQAAALPGKAFAFLASNQAG